MTPAMTREASSSRDSFSWPRTVVTGASSGIGRALALELARRGAPVLAVARSARQLQALAAQQPGIIPWPADLSRIDALEALVARWVAQYPDIGALVNNAGVQANVRVDDAGYGATDIAAEVLVNLASPIALTCALLPHLQRQPRGWVVNVGSVLGFCPKPTAAVYSATKAGMILFTQALRVQFQGCGVQAVLATMPLVDTAMTAGRGHGKLAPEEAARQLVEGLLRGQQDIDIGKARAARWLHRWSPSTLQRMLSAP